MLTGILLSALVAQETGEPTSTPVKSCDYEMRVYEFPAGKRPAKFMAVSMSTERQATLYVLQPTPFEKYAARLSELGGKTLINTQITNISGLLWNREFKLGTATHGFESRTTKTSNHEWLYLRNYRGVFAENKAIGQQTQWEFTVSCKPNDVMVILPDGSKGNRLILIKCLREGEAKTEAKSEKETVTKVEIDGPNGAP